MELQEIESPHDIYETWYKNEFPCTGCPRHDDD